MPYELIEEITRFRVKENEGKAKIGVLNRKYAFEAVIQKVSDMDGA
jgi:hypothetical protein